jgi:hypothetical protein
LKLSTSSEALLLPRDGLSAAVRFSPVSLSCGSIDANVRENGLAGTPLGDVAECGAWYPLVEPVHTSAVAISVPRTGVSVSCCPANTLVEDRSAEGTKGAERDVFMNSL